MTKIFSFTIKLWYFFGIIFGIFTFRVKYGKVRNKIYLKFYSYFLHIFILFFGLPVTYIKYYKFVFEKIIQEPLAVLVIDITFVELILSYLLLTKTLFFNKIKISDLMQDGLNLQNCLNEFFKSNPASSKYFRLICLKFVFFDVIPILALLYNTYALLYQLYNEPGVFTMTFAIVASSILNVAESFKNFAYLNAAYFIGILNEELKSAESTNELSSKLKIEKILILHEKLSKFVLNLLQFSGFSSTAILNWYFVGLVCQVRFPGLFWRLGFKLRIFLPEFFGIFPHE